MLHYIQMNIFVELGARSLSEKGIRCEPEAVSATVNADEIRIPLSIWMGRS